MRFVYDRLPNERIDMYQGLRTDFHDREQHIVNKRFPELEKAREAFMGPIKNKSPLKKMQADDLCKFSSDVY